MRGRAERDNAVMSDLTERLDRILPQTQCGQCGYAGCRPYAEAMAAGEADIDRCPPGGDAGARARWRGCSAWRPSRSIARVASTSRRKSR